MSSFPVFAYLALALLTIMLERALGTKDKRFRVPALSDWTQFLLIVPAGATFLMALYESTSSGATPSVVAMIIGALIWALAIAVRVRAHADVRQALASDTNPEGPMPLVADGIYGAIRHPMLLSLLMMMIAWPLYFSARYAWVFAFVGLLGILSRMRIEEIAMMVRNEEYVEYREKTDAFIPKVY